MDKSTSALANLTCGQFQSDQSRGNHFIPVLPCTWPLKKIPRISPAGSNQRRRFTVSTPTADAIAALPSTSNARSIRRSREPLSVQSRNEVLHAQLEVNYLKAKLRESELRVEQLQRVVEQLRDQVREVTAASAQKEVDMDEAVRRAETRVSVVLSLQSRFTVFHLCCADCRFVGGGHGHASRRGDEVGHW